MTLSERIKKIREFRGLKQAAIAKEMHVTQQAYSGFETKSDNLRLETLRKLCAVLNIDMAFLIATDIPINEETVSLFEKRSSSSVFGELNQLKSKISTYKDIFATQSMAHH